MFYKYSSDHFTSDSMRSLFESHDANLSRVPGEHGGSYHEPHLLQLYGNLRQHAIDANEYGTAAFPALPIMDWSGNPDGTLGFIDYKDSPRLSAVIGSAAPAIQAISSSLSGGRPGCLGINDQPTGEKGDRFPSYAYLNRRITSHNGVPSLDNLHDLHDAQMSFLKRHGFTDNVHQCDDGICQSCPTCEACGKELGRSITGLFEEQHPKREETYDNPLLNPVHIQSLITTGDVLARHLLELGSTTDTRTDRRFAGHRQPHNNASSFWQTLSTLLYSAAGKDHEESGGTGGFKVQQGLIIPSRSRLSVTPDIDMSDFLVPSGKSKPAKEPYRPGR